MSAPRSPSPLSNLAPVFNPSSDISDDTSHDDSHNFSNLPGMYASLPAHAGPAPAYASPSGAGSSAAPTAPPAPAAVPVVPGTHRSSAPASPPASGAPAHSESYEGSMDMSIVPRSPAMCVPVGELNSSLDPTQPAATAPPSPGLRECTNMPMPPPSARGRVATAKEGVSPHTPPTSGRVSPTSSTGSQRSRSGWGTRAARPSRGAAQPLMQSTPAVLGAQQSQKVPAFGRTAPGSSHASVNSDGSWPDFQGLYRQLRNTEKALAKEREEREREVKLLHEFIEKEKEGRAMDAKYCKILLQEKDERLREKDEWLREKDEWLRAKDDHLKILIQEKHERLREKDERLRAKDERRETEVGLYKGMIAMLTERCEELKKEVEEMPCTCPRETRHLVAIREPDMLHQGLRIEGETPWRELRVTPETADCDIDSEEQREELRKL
ncbi:hypothetical protein TRAPUB_2470 [Trametes pubescens]|uniref:Uncharacterized protein n=1 Tax=Trametes pubescens TaxID=154538 RepID=A0A1M2VGH2_TRAPU|nr:hypothetical protein TRAPUB_2470 [Trametes pubescens]